MMMNNQNYNAQQNQLLQKLMQEMNSKNDDNVERENNDLLSKIEQIEKENQKLAQGIGEFLCLIVGYMLCRF